MALERRGIVFVAFGLHDRSCEADKLDLCVGNVEPKGASPVPNWSEATSSSTSVNSLPLLLQGNVMWDSRKGPGRIAGSRR